MDSTNSVNQDNLTESSHSSDSFVDDIKPHVNTRQESLRLDAKLTRWSASRCDLEAASTRHVSFCYALTYCLIYAATGTFSACVTLSLPSWQSDLHVSESQVSLIYTSLYSGYILGSLYGGRMVEHNVWQSMTHLFDAVFGILVCVLLFLMQFGVFLNLSVLVTFWGFIGVFYGTIDTVCVVYIFRVYPKDGALVFARLWFAFSLAQIVYTFVYDYEYLYDLNYVAICLTVLYALIISFVLKTPLPSDRFKTGNVEKTLVEMSQISPVSVQSVSDMDDFDISSRPDANSPDPDTPNLQNFGDVKLSLDNCKDLNCDTKQFVNVSDQEIGLSKCQRKVYAVCILCTHFFLYFGEGFILAFAPFYCKNELKLRNGEEHGRKLISYFYIGCFVGSLISTMIFKFVGENVITGVSKFMILLIHALLIVLQIVHANDGLGQEGCMLALNIVFVLDGIFSTIGFNATLGLFEPIHEVNGSVSAGIALAYSVSFSLSGYCVGVLFESAGYWLYPYLATACSLLAFGLTVGILVTHTQVKKCLAALS